MNEADFLVIGGGVAGVSAAARLACEGRTIVLEAEEAFGYHSSGRSAAFFHFGLGNPLVRALTAHSRSCLEGTSDDGVALSRPTPAMFIARPEMMAALDTLELDMSRFTDGLERLDEREIRALVPILECGGDDIVAAVIDRSARRIDSEALQQFYRAAIRANGGELVTGARACAIERDRDRWSVTTQAGDAFTAKVIVNAAGAWADDIARLANVRPLGLRPLRRTIIVFDPPQSLNVGGWPFTKTVADEFYMLPESGRLLASPVDEVLSNPTDARPEDYDIALAASKVEEFTSLTVRTILHSWAGLRTFTSDRMPAVGFAPDREGFFWLAGQGGFGLQTSPAMSEIAHALITGGQWPADLAENGAVPELVAPGRFERARVCG